jgi:hypothetical protein
MLSQNKNMSAPQWKELLRHIEENPHLLDTPEMKEMRDCLISNSAYLLAHANLDGKIAERLTPINMDTVKTLPQPSPNGATEITYNGSDVPKDIMITCGRKSWSNCNFFFRYKEDDRVYNTRVTNEFIDSEEYKIAIEHDRYQLTVKFDDGGKCMGALFKIAGKIFDLTGQYHTYYEFKHSGGGN